MKRSNPETSWDSRSTRGIGGSYDGQKESQWEEKENIGENYGYLVYLLKPRDGNWHINPINLNWPPVPQLRSVF
jgi:hypothetical protein